MSAVQEKAELRIDGPCRVRLRCGHPLDVEPYRVAGLISPKGRDVPVWYRDGRVSPGVETPIDIVAILPSAPDVIDGPQPVATSPVPGCYSEGETKAVIEGVKLEPGEWVRADGEVVEVDVCDSPGFDVRTHYRDAAFIAYSGELPDREWVAYYTNGEPCESAFPQFRIIRRHVPAPVESPSLMEELACGIWWADFGGGKPIRVEVVRVPCHDGFAAAWTTAHSKLISPINEAGRFGNSLNVQLLRRYQPPTVRAYESDDDKGRMFGKVVRRKSDGAQRRIWRVSDHGVDMPKGLSVSFAELAREFTRLDGSAIGIVTTDPFDADPPMGG